MDEYDNKTLSQEELEEEHLIYNDDEDEPKELDFDDENFVPPLEFFPNEEE